MKIISNACLLAVVCLCFAGFPARSFAQLTKEEYSLYYRIVTDPDWKEYPGVYGSDTEKPPIYPSITKIFEKAVQNKSYAIIEAGLGNSDYSLRSTILRQVINSIAIEDRKMVLLHALVNPAIWPSDSEIIVLVQENSYVGRDKVLFQAEFVGLLSFAFNKKLEYPQFFLTSEMRNTLSESLRSAFTVPPQNHGSATPLKSGSSLNATTGSTNRSGKIAGFSNEADSKERQSKPNGWMLYGGVVLSLLGAVVCYVILKRRLFGRPSD